VTRPSRQAEVIATSVHVTRHGDRAALVKAQLQPAATVSTPEWLAIELGRASRD